MTTVILQSKLILNEVLLKPSVATPSIVPIVGVATLSHLKNENVNHNAVFILMYTVYIYK